MNPPWLSWASPQPTLSFQGVARLELVLQEAAPRALLTVRLLKSWSIPFAPEHFEVRGLTQRADLRWHVALQDGGERRVVLAFDEPGPPQDYALAVRGGEHPVDPFFRERVFTFSLECERGDPRAAAEAPTGPRGPAPAVDLLTKDYDGFVTMLTGRVKARNPYWADLSPASMERVLVDLIAHHGDMLSYYQDRVAAEAFLDTATQRYSVRQHAALLGVPLFDGSAAEALVAFVAPDDRVLPEGTEVSPPPETGAPVAFHLVERTEVRADQGEISFAAWPGAPDAVIPSGATEVLLWGHLADMVPGRRLCFAKGPTEVHPVRVVHAEHLRLTGWVERPTDAPTLDAAVVTRVAFDPPLPEALPPWGDDPVTLFGNLAVARFGSLRTERLDLIARSFVGRRADAIVEARDGGRPLLRALRLSLGPALFHTVRGADGAERAAPDVSVRAGPRPASQPWERVEHLHESRSYDRHYVAHLDEDGSLWLEFGDGRRGQGLELLADGEVASAEELRVDYRVGDPVDGNVTVGALTHVVAAPGVPTSGLMAINVTPGSGGRRHEPLDAARVRVPASLRHGPVERAVTLADYERAATIPGVARAVARAPGGPFNTVLVLADPEGRSGLSDGLRSEVQARLDALRMAGREVVVRAPEYVPIEVRLALCVAPGALAHRVRDAVLAALRPGVRGAPGFFHPDRLTFGQTLELGEVLAAAQAVPGVRSVKALRFRRMRSPGRGAVEEVIRLGITEVARLDADPTAPGNGTLAVLVVGIDPGVREQDFVIEEAP